MVDGRWGTPVHDDAAGAFFAHALNTSDSQDHFLREAIGFINIAAQCRGFVLVEVDDDSSVRIRRLLGTPPEPLVTGLDGLDLWDEHPVSSAIRGGRSWLVDWATLVREHAGFTSKQKIAQHVFVSGFARNGRPSGAVIVTLEGVSSPIELERVLDSFASTFTTALVMLPESPAASA